MNNKPNGFEARFASKNDPEAGGKTIIRSKSRVQPSSSPYVKLHISQLVRLVEVNDPVACMLFVILLGESFANKRGQPFELPTRALTILPGLKNLSRFRAKLRKLAQADLITVTTRPSKAPIIYVPLAL